MSRGKKAAQGLRNRIESIAKTDGRWPLLSIATVLHVLSILYGGVMAIRARLYKAGLLPSRQLPCRVVSIGNITAGGTGKTPMTIYVAQTIRDLGYRVAVISRGYKGRLEHSGGVVSDGRTVFHGPDDVGDEPYLMATSLIGIPVVVGGDRYQAGMLAVRRFAPDVIVLDDAFQHLRLKRDLDLVLLDHQAPLGNGYLLPRGRLREPVSALRRADALVFTRSKEMVVSDYFLSLLPINEKHIFYTAHTPTLITSNSEKDNMFLKDTKDISDLQGKTAVAFSGLADNEQFFDTLEKVGCKILHKYQFNDHHSYNPAEIDGIVKTASRLGTDLLITTLKDAVKISSFKWLPNLIVIDVTIRLLDGDDRFNRFISEEFSKKCNIKLTFGAAEE
jgi:tetraacyldisaccharide 4'-kinase